MAKAKKLIIGTLAAGIMAVATCFVASASTESVDNTVNDGYNAFFRME